MRYLFLLLVLISSPAYAVSLSVVESTPTHIRFNLLGTEFQIELNSLRQGNVTLRSADLLNRIQGFNTQKTLRSAEVLDEATRTVDPGKACPGGGVSSICGFGERWHWCDNDRNPTPGDDINGTHLCFQDDVISNIEWNGEIFILSIRRAKNCIEDPTFVSC